MMEVTFQLNTVVRGHKGGQIASAHPGWLVGKTCETYTVDSHLPRITSPQTGCKRHKNNTAIRIRPGSVGDAEMRRGMGEGEWRKESSRGTWVFLRPSQQV